MAETAGLVIGAVSLATTLTTCVDCFEYVQLGRNLDKHYQRSLLKLDIAKLKLHHARMEHESQEASSQVSTTLAAHELSSVFGRGV